MFPNKQKAKQHIEDMKKYRSTAYIIPDNLSKSFRLNESWKVTCCSIKKDLSLPEG